MPENINSQINEENTAESSTLTEIRHNTILNNWARILALLIAGGALVGILILTIEGLSSKNYDYVLSLESAANLYGTVMALTIGVLFAYTTAHQTKVAKQPVKKDSAWMIIGKYLGVGVASAVMLYGASLANFASVGVIPLSVVGVYLYYRLFKSNRVDPALITKDSIVKRAGVAVIILSLIWGSVIGFVLMILLTYPLSKHACELSGSKYC